MKKICSLLFCLAVFLFFVTGVSAQRQTSAQVTRDPWIGKYEYTYTEPATSGGWVPSVEYKLVVSQERKSLIAHLTVNGYQATVDYQYTAKPVGNQLNFYFLKNLNKTGMPLRNRSLKKGQLSGTLIRITERGRTKYFFKNEAFFNSSNPPVFKKKN